MGAGVGGGGVGNGVALGEGAAVRTALAVSDGADATDSAGGDEATTAGAEEHAAPSSASVNTTERRITTSVREGPGYPGPFSLS